MTSIWRHRPRASPLVSATVLAHGVGAATILASPSLSAFVIGGLIVNHGVIGAAGLFPRCGWLGPNITRLPDGVARDRVIALTFDDGPDPEITPRVLDLLAQAGQRATFFCIGEKAEAHPALVTEIRRRGHGIENHTHRHPNLFALRGGRAMAREVLRAQNAIEHSGGARPAFFRAPAGIQNPFLPGVLADAGLCLVSWTRRGFDTVTRDGTRVAARLIGRGLTGGEILLLHDGAPAARLRQQQAVVLESLPRVLDAMSRAGLRSAALHDVLSPVSHMKA